MDAPTEPLYPCNNCGRTFKQDTLNRHEPVCRKTAQKKRKVFDSGKMRAQGTDIPVSKTLRPGQAPKPDPKLDRALAKKANWRTKHDDFINSIRAAKQYTHAVETGGPLPPPPPPAQNPDFIDCPYCARRFNEKAADRHIPFCKEQHSRINPKGPSSDIRAKAAARTQYKAPAPKGRSEPPPRAAPASRTTGGYGSPSGTGGGRAGIPTRAQPVGGARGRGSMNAHPNGYQAGRYAPDRTSPPSGVGSAGDEYEPPSNGVVLRTGKSRKDYIAAQELVRANQSGARVGRAPIGGGMKRGGYAASGDNIRRGSGGRGMSMAAANANASRFCHECGYKFPVDAAKFCVECGVRRL